MGTTKPRRTGGLKPRLVGENHENRCRPEDDEPVKGICQTNAGIYICCPKASMAQDALFSYSTFSWSSRRGYRLLRHCSATGGLLAIDLVILNYGQETGATPELVPPLLSFTPHQWEDV
ncbi:hypothetical protein TNCV_4500511 [Trichonephila clavipes]|nr:hypothetical protein TNCV_4500511 [Trichonephila clavipes]